MTRALACTGVLGGGTALVFALAFLTSMLFPQGSIVAASWNGGWVRPMIDVAPMGGPIGGGWTTDVQIKPLIDAQAPITIAPAVPVPAPIVAPDS
jgi:hypothetical protein